MDSVEVVAPGALVVIWGVLDAIVESVEIARVPLPVGASAVTYRLQWYSRNQLMVGRFWANDFAPIVEGPGSKMRFRFFGS